MSLLASVAYSFIHWIRRKKCGQGLPSASSQTIIKDHKKLKTWNEVRPSETPEELLKELLPFVEWLRESGNVVSTTILTVELLQRSPELLHIGFVPLCHCVLCFLKKHH
jgi:hypothetical protein